MTEPKYKIRRDGHLPDDWCDKIEALVNRMDAERKEGGHIEWPFFVQFCTAIHVYNEMFVPVKFGGDMSYAVAIASRKVAASNLENLYRVYCDVKEILENER